MPLIRNLQIRWKLQAVVLPLVIVSALIVGTIVGYVSQQQTYLAIIRAKKTDLEHIAQFTLDLLNVYYQQARIYKKNKQHLNSGGFGFKQGAFQALKESILSKKVGVTGYIYTMTTSGELTIHPFLEGQNIYDAQDENEHFFIREMIENKNGWIRYTWKTANDSESRIKLVHYRYFPPWDWIIVVGSYEDELYRPADEIENQIFISLGIVIPIVGSIAVILAIFLSKKLVDTIRNIITRVQEINQGHLNTRLPIVSNDELGELAHAFNSMMENLQRNKTLADQLAQQDKITSLGVLSSHIVQQIDVFLGTILGQAAYLESKMIPSDPKYKYVQEIKRESKHCKNIIQNLLESIRLPKPIYEKTDINVLLDQMIDFTVHFMSPNHMTVEKTFDPNLPQIQVDRDQLRQVVINLIRNAKAAMIDDGHFIISTSLTDENTIQLIFQDNGIGIASENIEKIFDPFFTTKSGSIGLGLVLTKAIIEQQGGTIHISSQIGKGTTVAVTLSILERHTEDALAETYFVTH